MVTELTRLEAALRRDRTVVLAGLAAVTAVAWVYLVYLVWRMRAMGTMAMAPEMAMPQMQSWGALELLVLFVMWTVMMVAMMVPSVAPLVLMFTRANRQKGGGRVVESATLLLLGYLLVWTGFRWPGNSGAVETSQCRPFVPHDGKHQLGSRRPSSRGCRPLSIHPAEASLSGALSLTPELLDVGVAGRAVGNPRHGAQARSLLCGLLLDSHGPSVRCRSHEPALGGGHRCLHTRGESRTKRGAAQQRTYSRPAHRACYFDWRIDYYQLKRVQRPFGREIELNFLPGRHIARRVVQVPTVCTIKKSIEIKAPKKKVWNVLIDPKFVAIWSSEFSPGSHVEGDFTTGSTVIFKDGEGNGLRGKVINHTLHEYLKIEYDASLKNGVLEGQESDETKKWTGCLDMYEVLERGRVIQFDQSCLTDNPA